ncbi:MAG: DUF1992 domain-containing protein [Deltaproteobacteria bacterium]|nr:DUF1992 domain-containing protein [Deltaproteobacteria bacterium]
MFTGFEKIVEERIRAAQQKGEFEDLPGKGKPLPREDVNVPEDIRMAYKILKNADCIPPELEIKKEIRSTQELLSGMGETGEKYNILKKLNFLILKLNSLRSGPVHFDVPQYYMDPITERLSSKGESSDTGRGKQIK